MSDIAHALAQAFRRGAVVYCIDIDRVFSVGTPIPELLDAIANAEEAGRRAANADKQARATTASQKKRARRKLEKLAIARPKWRDRNFTVDQISAECGLSRRTLYTSLGPRWEYEKGAQHV